MRHRQAIALAYARGFIVEVGYEVQIDDALDLEAP